MMDKLIIVIYNTLILLMPYTLNYKGISYSKILFIFSILVTMYLLFTKRINKKLFQNSTFKYLTIGFLIFSFLVIISNCVNFIQMKKIILGDIFEILRILQYYLIILNFSVLFNLRQNKKTFTVSLVILLIINFVLAFFQFHNLFDLNKLYIRKIAPTQYVTLVNNYPTPRAVGLAGNPNVLGFCVSLIANYILYLILKEPKKYCLYIGYFLSLITVFLTASRTSYITLIIGGCMLIFLYYFRINKKSLIKFFQIGLVFAFLHLFFLFSLPKIYTWRINAMFFGENLNSWEQRLDKTQQFIEEIKEEKEYIKQGEIKEEKEHLKQNSFISYLIGNGSRTKEVHIHYDNEWLQLFDYYGFIGIIAYILMLLLPLFTIKSNEKFNYKLYLAILIMTFVYMIPAATYHCYLLFAIISILISYCLNYEEIKTEKQITKKKTK